jgi:hypothetical protein
MDMENNGNKETLGFRQIQTSVRIKIICSVFFGVL